jgi:hypothetical protein
VQQLNNCFAGGSYCSFTRQGNQDALVVASVSNAGYFLTGLLLQHARQQLTTNLKGGSRKWKSREEIMM